MSRVSEATTIPAVILDRAQRTPELVALVEGTTQTTYAELVDLIDGSARAMLAAGIGHGDRVALWAPNSVRWIVAALGVPVRRRGDRARSTPATRRPRLAYPIVRTSRRSCCAEWVHGRRRAGCRRSCVADGAEAPRMSTSAPRARLRWASFLGAGPRSTASSGDRLLPASGPRT